MAERTREFSSFSSSYSSKNYDVFLNFNDDDTGKKFTSHLFYELDRSGIQTFMNKEGLGTREEFPPSLLKAIAESRISIPIFSINYASSEWCLDELVKIMEPRDTMSQLVFPIFYNVNPRDVRNQTEGFGQKFNVLAKDFDSEKVESWKKVLKRVGRLQGWDLKNIDNGNESKLIQQVLRRIWSELGKASFNVTKKLVGVHCCVMRLTHLVNIKSEDVRFVGIWGMGGIGKSTVAKALFKHISQNFQGGIFLENVGETSKQQGLEFLQKRLLSPFLNEKILQCISNVDRGKFFIKKCLSAKKVLIILDDVDKTEQLEALAGGLDWFDSGSRIIITTRDKHVLSIHKEPEIYEVKELYFYPSLQLFSKHAFQDKRPHIGFMKLSKDVALTAGGLPLALENLGRFLCDTRSREEWKSALCRLRKSPHQEVLARLKLSYDVLQHPDKQIFRDIACFFIGTDKEYATAIWDGCNFDADIGMKILIEKSLIKIDHHNKLRMHDQLRDMGRDIVRQESSSEPGKRSRLWSHAEVMDVLQTQKGTDNIEGIVLKFEGEETVLEKNRFHTKDFEAMSKLRLLQIDNVHLEGEFKKFPSGLRWLSWKGCPLKSIPTDFHLENLSVLDLSSGRIKQVWKGRHQNKQFPELKVLSLSKCRYLTKTPDFSSLPKLKILNLEGCTELKKLRSSICKLNYLKNLNLSGCSNLEKVPELHGSLNKLEVLKLEDCKLLSTLPDSIGSMRNLKSLSLDRTIITELPDAVGSLKKIEVLTMCNCTELVKLPYSIGKMGLLKRFAIDRTGIVELPNDFGMLSSLEVLSMSGCRKFKSFPENFGRLIKLRDLNVGGNSKLCRLPDSFCGLCLLTSLDASGCNLLEGGIPRDFGKLSSLEKLFLSHNNFRSLPDSISNLSRLEYLGLDNCRNLQSLPKLPSSLRILNIKDCISLETLSNLSDVKGVYQLNISNCRKLAEFPGIEEMKSLQEMYTRGCNTALVNGVSKSFGQRELQHLSIRFSFPDHFTIQKLKLSDAVIWDEKRCEIRLQCGEVPIGHWNPEQHRKIIGVDLHFVFTNKKIRDIYVQVNRNGECVYSKQKVSDDRFFTSSSHQDHSCLCHLHDCFYQFVCELKEGDEISFTIETAREMEVRKSGMYVVYEDAEQSTCCKRIGDFFTCSYDDGDVIDIGRASSRMGRKLQLLHHDNDFDGGRTSGRKRRKLQLLDHDDDDTPFTSSLKDGAAQLKKEALDLN